MKDPELIDALLPQTQCGECGYNGCMPYAEALARGEADPNLCAPGGESTLQAIAEALQIDARPWAGTVKTRSAAVASINEEECIGCTKCINACPVDAIIGTGKLMHAIISHECTGCGLCIEPCPVDCISLESVPENNYNRESARQHYLLREKRRALSKQAKIQKYQTQTALHKQNLQQDKIDYIMAAMQRVKAKKV